MFDTKSFGARLSILRKASGLTHEELAEILHISLNHEYRLESGNRSPTIDLCLQISEHFNVSLDSLLCGTIRPASTEKQVLQKAIQLLSDLERQLP